MLQKLKLIFAAFKQGKQIANPSAWKSRQVDAALIAAFLSGLVLLAKAFGYDIPMDSEAILAVSTGIYAGVNYVITIVTSKKIGFVPEQTSEPVAIITRTNVQPKPPSARKKKVQTYTEVVTEAPHKPSEAPRGQFDSTTDA